MNDDLDPMRGIVIAVLVMFCLAAVVVLGVMIWHVAVDA